MRTIILTRRNALLLTRSALSATSKDDITPVICGALLTAGKTLRVTSTDRYRVHTALIPAEEISYPHEFIISNAALLWLSKNLNAFGHSGLTRVVIASDDKLTVSVSESGRADSDSVTWSGHAIKGNFPPVIKLIETARAAETRAPVAMLDLGSITKTKALARDRHTNPRMKFTAAGDNAKKPGTVLFTFIDPETREVYAEALIQPYLDIEGIES